MFGKLKHLKYNYAGTVLQIDTHLKPIKVLIGAARKKWKDIGRRLGSTEEEIEAINKLDDGKCLDFLLQNLNMRYTSNEKKFVEHLSIALKSDDIGHADMAIALEVKVLPQCE